MFSREELEQFNYYELIDYIISCQYAIEDLNDEIKILQGKITNSINKDFEDYKNMMGNVLKNFAELKSKIKNQ